MKYPIVSVVIAAYNEEKDLPNLLKSLKDCDYPKNKLEVIVVDDGSTDKTRQIIESFKSKVITGPHKGVGNARNLGWKAAKGEIVSFLDADMIVSKYYVKEIVKYFNKHQNVVALEDKEFLHNKENLLARLHQLRHELGWSQLRVFIPRVFRKKTLEQFNGFDQDYGYYIDLDLYKRILNKGLKIGHAEKAIMYHKQVEGLGELFSQCRWNGRSMVFAFKNYRMDAIKRIIFVLLNSLFPLYILALFFPMPFKILGFLGLLVFLYIELNRSIKMYVITKQWESFLTPIFDIVSMTFVLYGIIDKFLSKPRTPVR